MPDAVRVNVKKYTIFLTLSGLMVNNFVVYKKLIIYCVLKLLDNPRLSSMNTLRTTLINGTKLSKTKNQKLDYTAYWKIIWRSITPNIKPTITSKITSKV
jgi:hypothetical protein